MKLFRYIWNEMTHNRFNEGYGHGYNKGAEVAMIATRRRTVEDCLIKLEQESVQAFSNKSLVNATKGAKREDLLRLGYEHAMAMLKQVL